VEAAAEVDALTAYGQGVDGVVGGGPPLAAPVTVSKAARLVRFSPSTAVMRPPRKSRPPETARALGWPVTLCRSSLRAPVEASRAAMASRGAPATLSKSPAAYTWVSSAASARTVASAPGFQSSSFPVRESNAARRVRPYVFEPTRAPVNDPPT
jgi:hypothetical protein